MVAFQLCTEQRCIGLVKQHFYITNEKTVNFPRMKNEMLSSPFMSFEEKVHMDIAGNSSYL